MKEGFHGMVDAERVPLSILVQATLAESAQCTEISGRNKLRHRVKPDHGSIIYTARTSGSRIVTLALVLWVGEAI